MHIWLINTLHVISLCLYLLTRIAPLHKFDSCILIENALVIFNNHHCIIQNIFIFYLSEYSPMNLSHVLYCLINSQGLSLVCRRTVKNSAPPPKQCPQEYVYIRKWKNFEWKFAAGKAQFNSFTQRGFVT